MKDEKIKKNAVMEFNKLCKKYPDTRFIGNCIFDCSILKKGTYIFHSRCPKKSLLQKEKYIIIRNIFKGKYV